MWKQNSQSHFVLQNLLKETQDLGRGSDTTSGCESGHSSELGDRELGGREGEELEEEEVLLPDYTTAPPTWLGPESPGYSHCVEAPPPIPDSYTKVGSLQDAPGYVNQINPATFPTSTEYSSPPPIPTPVTLNPTLPPLQAGYSTVVSTLPAAPSHGYVTFNSVKSTATEAPSPGYITLSQLSPSKENPERKESGNLSPSSLPPGYSRVGLNSTPGYVAWASPPHPDPDAGEKLPEPSFEPPRQLEKEEDRDLSLVITPRSLGLREPMDSTGIASMV